MTPLASKTLRRLPWFAALLLAAGTAFAAGTGDTNDYPTEARADYVFACMETNGGTREALRRCSCSIDVIASILPYDKYVSAETILSVVQVGGDKSSVFRVPAMAEKVADLRRAQAEGEIRCF